MSNGSGRWRRLADQIWPRAAAIGAVLLLWWAVSASGLFIDTVLPPPGEALRAFADTFAQDSPPNRESLVQATQASVIRLIVGLGIGVLIGTIFGLAMAASTAIQRSLGSLMSGLQALPSISWLPLAMIWFGLNERAILFVVIIASIPAVATPRRRPSGSSRRFSYARAARSERSEGRSTRGSYYRPRCRRMLRASNPRGRSAGAPSWPGS